ncbi:hypothetical protein D3C76_1806700 [compost metagenome]
MIMPRGTLPNWLSADGAGIAYCPDFMMPRAINAFSKRLCGRCPPFTTCCRYVSAGTPEVHASLKKVRASGLPFFAAFT